MIIRDLINKIANVFGYTFIENDEYTGLKEQIDSNINYKKHCSYIKHWVTNMGCKKVYLNWKKTLTYGEFIDVVDICGNKLVAKHNNSDDTYDIDLDYIEIPESFKKEKLGKDYRTI